MLINFPSEKFFSVYEKKKKSLSRLKILKISVSSIEIITLFSYYITFFFWIVPYIACNLYTYDIKVTKFSKKNK